MTLAEKTILVNDAAAGPREKLWTLQEWDHLVEIGFFNGQRLELIEGRIIQMSPQHVPHSVGIELVDQSLRRAFSKGYRIRIQSPFRSVNDSEPEPDVAVVAGDIRRAKEHPSTAILVVEISDTTLKHDRSKARLYAASGVPEYWILNLIGRKLEVYRDPRANKKIPAYESSQTLNEHDRIAPLSSKLEISVADLLP